MKNIEIILIGVSLAMDAFAISVCKGLRNNTTKNGIIISVTRAIDPITSKAFLKNGSVVTFMVFKWFLFEK